VARRLRTDFDLVDSAVAQGRLSWAHASVIVKAANPRIRTEMVEIQAELISAAKDCVFERWTHFVQGIARQLDVDGGYDPTGDIAANKLGLRPGADGTVLLDGELTAANGIEVRSAIDRVTDELFRRYHADHNVDPSLIVPERATLRALALVEICRRAHAVNIGSSKPPVNLTTVVVHADDPTGAAYTPDGGRFPAEAVATLRRDELTEALVVSSHGVPLHMGRATRLATPAQRRAAAVRDGGCVFPGCDAP
jgi:hypothetical protein